MILTRFYFRLLSFLGMLLAMAGHEISGVSVHLRSDPSAFTYICANQTVTFTCLVKTNDFTARYDISWKVNGLSVHGDSGFNNVLRINIPSTTLVECVAYTADFYHGSDIMTIFPAGDKPEISFQESFYSCTVHEEICNLTATVNSSSSLIYLAWKPHINHRNAKNKTLITKADKFTTIITLLLYNSTYENGGNYSLVAINSCGATSNNIQLKIECASTTTLIYPPASFTAVEGHNSTLVCYFKGKPPPLEMAIKAKYPNGADQCAHNCSVHLVSGCSNHTNSKDCCLFNFVLTCVPQLVCDGTQFSCGGNFTKEDTACMSVLPAPKVLQKPHDIAAVIGSTAEFTCEFNAKYNSAILQVHWLYNKSEIQQYKREIEYTISIMPHATNHVTSALKIVSVQNSSAGLYTCYCSYNTSNLDIAGESIIQSDHQSAWLLIKSGIDSTHGKVASILIGFAFFIALGLVVALAIIGVVMHRAKVRQRRNGYKKIESVMPYHRKGKAYQQEKQILPGNINENVEITAFKEIIAGGIPAIKTLSCDIQVEWEEIGTHMGLEASILKQIKQTNVSQVKECCMDVFVAWLNQHKQATWEDLLALLQVPSLEWNMIAKGLVHHLHGQTGYDGPIGLKLFAQACVLSEDDRKIAKSTNPIQKHYAAIVQHVDPEQLLVQLKAHDLVTPDEEYMLLNANLSPQKQTKLLLQCLCSKNPVNSVQLFYRCLREETHHGGHQYLADLLEQDVRNYNHEAGNNCNSKFNKE